MRVRYLWVALAGGLLFGIMGYEMGMLEQPWTVSRTVHRGTLNGPGPALIVRPVVNRFDHAVVSGNAKLARRYLSAGFRSDCAGGHSATRRDSLKAILCGLKPTRVLDVIGSPDGRSAVPDFSQSSGAVRSLSVSVAEFGTSWRITRIDVIQG